MNISQLAKQIRDDDLETFTFAQAQEWSEEMGFSRERPSVVIKGLKEAGLTMVERLVAKKFRTLGDNPHDRWQASPTHGGGGGPAINGMASEG